MDVKKIRRSAIAGVWMSAILALLSLGMIVILSMLVINLGRLVSAPRDGIPPDVPYSLLHNLKIINGALLVVPLGIFLMCSYDLGKLIMNPAKALSGKVVASVSGKQGPLKKRPIIFGTLIFAFSAGVAAAFAYTGIVFQRVAAYLRTNGVPTTAPISPDRLTMLQQLALYSITVPGTAMLFSMGLIFKAIKDRKEKKAEAAAATADDT